MKYSILLYVLVILGLITSCKQGSPDLVSILSDGNKVLNPGESVQLSANVPVSWVVKNPIGGTIDVNGLFVAGDSSGIFEVEATNLANPDQHLIHPVFISNRADILNGLRLGGKVIYLRHAIATVGTDRPDLPQGWDRSCSPDTARQLSDAGREQARGLGMAFRKLEIPFHEAHYTSSFCRCIETLGLLDLEGTTVINDSITYDVLGDTLRHQKTQALIDRFVPGNKNILLVSHSFGPGSDYPQVEQGYAAVFTPGNGPTFVTIIRSDELRMFE